jgi:hypothetical protein
LWARSAGQTAVFRRLCGNVAEVRALPGTETKTMGLGIFKHTKRLATETPLGQVKVTYYGKFQSLPHWLWSVLRPIEHQEGSPP